MITTNKHNLLFKENGPKQQYIKCPWCGDDRKKKNSKTLSIDLDKRLYNCHHCGRGGMIDGYQPDEQKVYTRPQKTHWSNFKDQVQQALFARGFSIETIRANKIIQRDFVEKDGGEVKTFIGYPYFILGEKDPVNMKWRYVAGKEFKQEYNAMPVMYNLPIWYNLENLIICEGENDVMAFNEAGHWDATTLNGGAINENDKNIDGKLQAFHHCVEHIENKKIVYLATDNDGPGRRLRDELIKRIGADKCRILSFPEDCKDANDVLLKHGKDVLSQCLADAKEIPVSGVFYLNDQMDAMIDSFDNGNLMGETTYFGDVDTIFMWKKGQVNLWTGYMNHGKTTFFLQIALTKSIMDGWKWVIFSPENYPATDFYNDIVEMYVGRHVHANFRNKMTKDEFLEACAFINDHMIFVYPEDKHTIEALHATFSSLMRKHGIDGVLIDPYNQLESSFPGKRTDEEVSEFMRIVKRYTVENYISYNIVAHPKQPQKNSKDPGDLKAPDVRDIAGGAMWGNKSDNIIVVHRPYWFSDRTSPIVDIITEKIKRVRTGGKRGSTPVHYDFKTSRYHDGHSRYFCDPKRKLEIVKEQRTIVTRLPFADDPDDEETPF